MNRVKDTLDKWSMMLDDEKSVKDFRQDILELMVEVILDPELQADLDEVIDNEDDFTNETL